MSFVPWPFASQTKPVKTEFTFDELFVKINKVPVICKGPASTSLRIEYQGTSLFNELVLAQIKELSKNFTPYTFRFLACKKTTSYTVEETEILVKKAALNCLHHFFEVTISPSFNSEKIKNFEQLAESVSFCYLNSKYENGLSGECFYPAFKSIQAPV